MQVLRQDKLEANNSLYNSVVLQSNKNIYRILYVTGKFNYVSVKKENQPFSILGKEFENFDKAQEHYKQSEIKTMLLFAQTLLSTQ